MQLPCTVFCNNLYDRNTVSVVDSKIHGSDSSKSKKSGVINLIFILFTVILCSFSNVPNTKAQSFLPACKADSLCNWDIWDIYTVSIPVVVNGDTCNLTFTYQYRFCIDEMYSQLKVISWSMPDNTCPFKYYMDSLYASNSTAYNLTQRSIDDQGTLALQKLRFLYWRHNFVPASDSANFNCDNSFDCTLSGNISHYYYQETLTYYDKCSEYIDVQGGGLLGGGQCLGTTYVADCYSMECCILIRDFCYDNGTVRSCETTVVSPGHVVCWGNAQFTAPYGCNILRRSGCIPRCQ